MRSLVGSAVLALAVLGIACSAPGEQVGTDDSNLNETGSKMPSQGTLALTLTADKGAASDDVVSFGLPFPEGVLKDAANVTVLDASGNPVAIATKTLAKWPADGSIRSVLVAFKATLAEGESESWKVEYGDAPKGEDAGELEANPDGPVIASLPAEHYAASHVSGVLLAKSKNDSFPQYETAIDEGADAFDLNDYGLNCESSSSERTYYDGPHARYQRALRSGEARDLRAAHAESVFYRENELDFSNGRKLAVYKCQKEWGGGEWTPSQPLDWGTLRQMLSQGSLDDYLVTGDPAAKEAVLAMGEAFRQNLPVLSKSDAPVLEITERNLGWTLMGLTSYYALDQRSEVKTAMEALVQRAIAWQARGDSGGLEHDINRPDPDECEEGPSGASPFMTSLVVDGMMDYWLLTNETEKLAPFMTKLSSWYEKDALTSDRTAFKYLVGCNTNAYETGDPDEMTSPELNLLIVHVLGATYALTKDKHWLELGDALVETGIDAMYAGRPKQWNQATRSFGKYLGYRAM